MFPHTIRPAYNMKSLLARTVQWSCKKIASVPYTLWGILYIVNCLPVKTINAQDMHRVQHTEKNQVSLYIREYKLQHLQCSKTSKNTENDKP